MTSSMRHQRTRGKLTSTHGIAVTTRHVCLSCRARRALFAYRGGVKADADHTLCFQCYRGLRDSMRMRFSRSAS